MTAPSWRLEDARGIADANPYTFYKPSPEAIAALVPGERAKLIFLFDGEQPDAPGGERMWVEIEAVEDGVFQGRLANQPLHIEALTVGDPVRFEACHIIGVSVVDPVPSLADRYAPRCLISRRAYVDGAGVGFMYREAPAGDDDSGWSFMSGDEDEVYLADPKNVYNVTLGAVLARDDSFVTLLDREPEVAFERNGNGRFVEVPMPQ
ncbi:hypothetical protein Y5W_02585 [Alcanivorax sp. 521-1]|uniref:Immunity protein Imm33 domain-containing protein n=1 Tax=Alloalcanivorax profundimaris TaxID=2735259 RepID=A0ABS0AUY5_9GAMM|nr:DUF2185 domain-containing protein [Alloalcanivorax profundimaris]MBF5057291.1 hypothetical protein [Alloalcanivorax profundimaris]